MLHALPGFAEGPARMLLRAEGLDSTAHRNHGVRHSRTRDNDKPCREGGSPQTLPSLHPGPGTPGVQRGCVEVGALGWQKAHVGAVLGSTSSGVGVWDVQERRPRAHPRGGVRAQGPSAPESRGLGRVLRPLLICLQGKELFLFTPRLGENIMTGNSAVGREVGVAVSHCTARPGAPVRPGHSARSQGNGGSGHGRAAGPDLREQPANFS